jgi:hypothetical protein
MIAGGSVEGGREYWVNTPLAGLFWIMARLARPCPILRGVKSWNGHIGG